MLTARLLAVAIAIAAVADPAITSMRRTKPEIAVVPSSSARAGDAAEVAAALDDDYTVIDAPFPNASATVVVGASLPANAPELAAPVLAVAPGGQRSRVAIERVDAPSLASIESRVPVDIDTRVTGGAGRTLEVELSAGGLVIARATREVGTDGRLRVQTSFVPTTPEPAALRVVARIEGGPDSATVDFAVDVLDRRWSILFFDRRPSWMSTFVRRSLESDRRFVVASRVITSRGISIGAGQPPSTLEDPTLLDLYDAIVVGAPDAMTPRDVAGLEAFLRRRGGSAVLLFDQPAKSGPHDRLTRVARWSTATSAARVTIESPLPSDSGALQSTELMWPAALPPLSDVLATATLQRPIVWATPIGSGQLIVSGALDSWKYRDPAVSGFDRFWRATVAGAAKNAAAPVDLAVAPSITAPNEMISVTVGVRDARLASNSGATKVSVTGMLEGSPGRSDAVRFWPTERAGELVATVRAPADPGSYRVVVAANGHRVGVPVMVASRVSRETPDQLGIVAAFVGSRGGKVVEVGELRAELAAVVKAEPRMTRWHVMRSPWWGVAFVLMLTGEWWWRRRQGLG